MASEFDFDQYDDAPEEAMDFDQFDDAPEQEAGPEISKKESALRGAEQGLTFGFADEMGAGIQKGMDSTQAFFNKLGLADESPSQMAERMRSEGMTGDLPPTSDEFYDQALQETRQKYKDAEEANPKSFMAGDFAGGMLVPGAGGAKAAKLLSKYKTLAKAKKATDGLSTAKKAAGAAGAMGTLEAAGRSEADNTTDLLKDIAIGGGASAALGGTVGKIANKFSKGKLAEKAQGLSDEANLDALKSIGATKSDFLKELGQKTSKRSGVEQARGSGNALIDEGLVKLKQDPIELNTALNDKLDEVFMDRIMPVTQQLDQKLATLPNEVIQQDTLNLGTRLLTAVDELENINKLNPAGNDALVANAKASAEELMSQLANSDNPNKMTAVLEAKRKLSKILNSSDWDKSEVSGAKDYLKTMVSELRDYSESLANKVDPDLTEELIKQNRVYGQLSDAKEIAIKELAKDSAASGISMGDYIVGGLGAGVGGLPGTLAAIAAKKGLEKGTGKDIPQLLKTYQALRKSKKAGKLMDRANNYGGTDKLISENATTLAGRATQAAAATMDSTEVREPFRKNRVTADYVKNANPEELVSQADEIRQKYGKTGEQLAGTLEKIAKRDKTGRSALIFSLLQSPQNRKMLGLIEEKE